MAEERRLPHKLTIDERQKLTLTGATEILRFDEEAAVIAVEAGSLVVQGRELKLKTLSAYVGYSEYHLSRKFRQEMGVSIGAYTKYVRVERAKLLLLSTDMPIAQIGEALHFASPSHFAGSFREVTGMTPQQFRKK